MKAILGLTILLSVLALNSAQERCDVAEESISKDWVTMKDDPCVAGTVGQIKKEFQASMAYLELAAYFSRDSVNRPGFAELFFNAAREEREHGIKLIEYLTMRGKVVDNVNQLLPNYESLNIANGTSGVWALEKALELEVSVTKNIVELIRDCEFGKRTERHNDYHFVDYLTGVYLEEQHKGQREIAGKLTTLKKMWKSQGKLAEFLFDKEL